MNREYAEVLVEQNMNGAMDTAYVYGASAGTGSGRLSLNRFDGSTGYYLYDPRGSVTGITNEDGQVYQSYRYSAFGEVTFGAPRYENEYTYNGESYNPNIRCQYLRARYYDVVKAAFATEDFYPQDMWALWTVKEPLTLNRYSYCVGNPVNYADKSGHWVENDIAKAILDDPSISKEDKGREINKRIQFYQAMLTLSFKDANYNYVMNFDYEGNEAYFEQKIAEAAEKRAVQYVGSDDINYGRVVIIPEVVKGEVNGEEIELRPLENWGGIGAGKYPKGVQKDENGRYEVAVGPKIINPDYPDSGRIWPEDFAAYSNKIDVFLTHKVTGETQIIECVVVDFKAHTYNTYLDGQPYDTGDRAYLEVENGLIQTGIAYPNSWNATQNLACSPGHMDGRVIEFAGHAVDFEIEDYKLDKIIIIEE